ncbi:MAG: hypothetical protein J2P28_11390 [Actinobacteria bacterium]|nr:hypothetical protein [Actinomycetota bacterium]
MTYDSQTRRFLSLLTAGEDGLVLRGGFVSRSGVVSRYVVVQVPAGSPPDDVRSGLTAHQRAFERSLYYNFRAVYGQGRDERGSRLPMAWWLRIEWRGRDPRFAGRFFGAVIRIGPASARPWISGNESYVDNEGLRALSRPR